MKITIKLTALLLCLCIISCAENERINSTIIDAGELSEVDKIDGIDDDGLTDDEETTGIDDPATPADPNGEITDPEDPDSDNDGESDGEEATNGTDPNNPNDKKDNSQDDLVTSTDKCAFEQLDVKSGETISIDCLVDLDGKTVDIPEGVVLEFDGGDIFNGTLNFASSGKIDGELLNSNLTIEGDVQLTSEEFQLHPYRWEIVEGTVFDEVAKNNRLVINETFLEVKELGATTIKIDQIDAYFNNVPVDKERPQDAAIQIPESINLLMTSNSHLRKQPNNHKDVKLLTLFEADNSVIDGGFLHGDRDEHDYSDGGTHEWGHLIMIKSSSNVIVRNVTMMNAGGDGVSISALGHAFNDNHNPCNNVKVLNNKIISSRRAGISLTDGTDILIEGNEFIDVGTETEKSKGTGPGFAMNIEPIWTGGQKFEIVENVIFRNNIERGSENGGIVCARGHYITYEDNTMESTIYMGETIGSIVRNNTFENPTEASNFAIFAGNNDDYDDDTNHDNEVYGNTIIGFPKGIQLQDPGIDLHSNTIINCGSGIQIKNARNCKIRNNTITNEISDSEGIGTAFPKFIDDVIISDNIINVVKAPFRFNILNKEDYTKDFTVTVENNEVTSLTGQQSSIQDARGVIFKNNVCNNSGIRTTDASNGIVSGNSFLNNYIRISKGCSDMSYIDNIITSDTYCIRDEVGDGINIIKENNTCDVQ